jgi:hypothetical protein
MVLGGCSETPIPSPPTASPPSPDVIVSLPIHLNRFTPAGLFVGILEVKGQCLFLRIIDERRIGVAWPAGTRWDPRRRAITVNGVTAFAGETVHLGGGAVDIGPADIERRPWISPPLPDCLGDTFIFVGDLSLP